MYVVQIKDWLKVFPRHQFKIIRFEDYRSNRPLWVDEVVDFLGLGRNRYIAYITVWCKVTSRQTNKKKKTKTTAPHHKVTQMKERIKKKQSYRNNLYIFYLLP